MLKAACKNCFFCIRVTPVDAVCADGFPGGFPGGHGFPGAPGGAGAGGAGMDAMPSIVTLAIIFSDPQLMEASQASLLFPTIELISVS